MKKNLLTILILALLVINLVMNAILLLSVMQTNSKTAKLISDIAAALELEEAGGLGGGKAPQDEVVSVADTESKSLTADNELVQLTPLAKEQGGDGQVHYLQLKVTLYLNKASEDYAENAATVDGMTDRFMSIIKGVIAQYNNTNVVAAEAEIKATCLSEIQKLYDGSTFIFDIDFPTFITN